MNDEFAEEHGGWLHTGEWKSVSSSNVASIAYDHDAKELHVRFHSGHGGYYSGVEPSVALDMLNASSKGKFLHYRLKNRYPYHRN